MEVFVLNSTVAYHKWWAKLVNRCEWYSNVTFTDLPFRVIYILVVADGLIGK